MVLNKVMNELWLNGRIMNIVEDKQNNNKELLIEYEGVIYYLFLHHNNCEKIEIKNI